MKVVFFHRKPADFHFSMEKLFEGIRESLEGKIEMEVEVCPRMSTGIWNRWVNIWESRKKQGDINHITGDVNYINLLFNSQKTILTIHDLGFLKVNTGIKRSILQFFWITLPIRKSKIVTVISESTKEDLLQFLPNPIDPQKIRIINNYLSPEYVYTPKPFHAEYPVLLQVGTKYNKNLPRLFQALEGIPCRLDIVGKLNENQLKLLHQHQIDFQNFVHISEEEMRQRYIEADVVVFASTLEGFGLPILEAQGIGRPVITSNLSSMPEVAGEGACFVDPYEPKSIRAGILKLISKEDYRASLVQKGLENVKRYSREVIADQYLNLYQEIGQVQ